MVWRTSPRGTIEEWPSAGDRFGYFSCIIEAEDNQEESALAGLLIMVGVSMIKTHRLRTIFNTGTVSVTIMLITFPFTLFTPIQVAVLVGFALHIVHCMFQLAEAVRIKRILVQANGSYVEAPLPSKLPSGEVVILNPIGNLFFAGAAEFEENPPEMSDASGSVVIIRLRDRVEVGSTFIRIIERYGRNLMQRGIA